MRNCDRPALPPDLPERLALLVHCSRGGTAGPVARVTVPFLLPWVRRMLSLAPRFGVRIAMAGPQATTEEPAQ